jgi:hypothetical protein
VALIWRARAGVTLSLVGMGWRIPTQRLAAIEKTRLFRLQVDSEMVEIGKTPCIFSDDQGI